MVELRKLLMVVSLVCAGFAVAATASAQDQVNVRFSWKLKGEYAPLYLAQEKGYYQKERLNIRMGEGAGAQAALGSLIQGQEDVVVLPGIFALTAIQKGMSVKLIALYHPKTPVALISFPDKPVRTPKDLEGKTIATSVGETGTAYLDAFCKLNHVDCSKVRRVTMTEQARYPNFLQRQVDVVSVYEDTDLPIIEATQKTKFVAMDMVKYGLAVPGLALVTSDENIAKKADVLKRYLRATNEGIKDAKSNPDDAARALLKNWPGAPDPKIVDKQVEVTVKYIPAAAGHPVGAIDEKDIANALQLLHSVGEVADPKPVSAFYTNALLRQ